MDILIDFNTEEEEVQIKQKEIQKQHMKDHLREDVSMDISQYLYQVAFSLDR
jgi:hypothetical protein